MVAYYPKPSSIKRKLKVCYFSFWKSVYIAIACGIFLLFLFICVPSTGPKTIMNTFIVLTAILAVTQALPLSEQEHKQWEDFKNVYGKKYENEQEENLRKEIFAQKLKEFEEHEKKYKAGIVSYRIGVNQFADMTSEEFVKTLTPMNVSEAPVGLPFVPFAEPPSSIDWRQRGAVTPVKYQGQCGSCYTFSTTGALEGQLFLKTNNLVSLSEQNLVDCSPQTNGCNGGYPSNCFQYIKENGGIDTEESYPYEAQVGQCRYNAQNSGGTDTGFVSLTAGDENELLNAVGTVGPVSICLNAEGFQGYTTGIINGPCDKSKINHAVLAVGYGTSNDGQDFWIVKNSWGTQFGMEGYVYLARNQNQCGLASTSSYPLV